MTPFVGVAGMFVVRSHQAEMQPVDPDLRPPIFGNRRLPPRAAAPPFFQMMQALVPLWAGQRRPQRRSGFAIDRLPQHQPYSSPTFEATLGEEDVAFGHPAADGEIPF